MGRALLYLLELLGLFGLVGLLAFIPWTKMVLGAALSVIGAFFPNMRARRIDGSGEAELNWTQKVFKFGGGIRFCVIIGGVILMIGAVLDGHKASVANFASTTVAAQEEAEAAVAQTIEDASGGRTSGKADDALIGETFDKLHNTTIGAAAEIAPTRAASGPTLEVAKEGASGLRPISERSAASNDSAAKED